MTIETIDVTSRTKRLLWKKLFPIWWFMNDQEPKPPDWYLPNAKALSRLGLLVSEKSTTELRELRSWCLR
jgi:hypothetical protein